MTGLVAPGELPAPVLNAWRLFVSFACVANLLKRSLKIKETSSNNVSFGYFVWWLFTS